MLRKSLGFFFVFLFLLTFSISLIPLSAEAASGTRLIFCGRSADDPATAGDDSAPCTMCHLLLTGQGIMQWLMQIMTIIAIVVIVAMAIMYIVSAGNPGMMKTAKSGIIASLVGFALMLGAWLIVNIVLMTLADTSDTTKAISGLVATGSFSFACDVNSTAGSGVLTASGGTSAATSGATGGVPVGGGGSCSVPTGGNCSSASLSSTCFSGANLDSWSKICQVESGGGNASARSGTDICTNYGNRSFSGGLFQINVFSNGSLLGNSRCNALGSKGTCNNRRASDGVCLGWTCSINNVSDFDYCMGLTFTPAGSIAMACSLSGGGKNTIPWSTTANKCGIPKTL
ncbi:MAG: pilin [Patescibacteria group bacterium]